MSRPKPVGSDSASPESFSTTRRQVGRTAGSADLDLSEPDDAGRSDQLRDRHLVVFGVRLLQQADLGEVLGQLALDDLLAGVLGLVLGLLGVHLTFREMLSSAREAICRLRIDHAFLALPRLIRRGAVQWGWPLVFLYRLSQPYEVEGPGPDGETIVTTVPGKDLKDFVGQVSAAVGWKGQEVTDQRQVILWHALFAGSSAWLLNHALSLF